MAQLTQRQAAQQWAIPWTTFRRAVKAGKVTVSSDKTVDPAEMLRAFGEPAARAAAQVGTGTTGPSGTSAAQPGPPLEDLQAELARARTDLERAATEIAWRDRLLEERGRRLETLERLLLAPPTQAARPPGFWRRLFGG